MVRSYCECRKTAERCRLGSAPSWSVVTPILPRTREATDPSPSLLALLLELTVWRLLLYPCSDRRRRVAVEGTVEILGNKSDMRRRQ